MSADRPIVLDWIRSVAANVVLDSEDLAEIDRRIEAAPSLGAGAFSAEVIDLSRILGESARDQTSFAALGHVAFAASETRDAVIVLSAIAMAISVGRVGWPSRQAAREARSGLQDRAEEAYAVASRFGPPLYSWLRTLVQVSTRLVSEKAADATPMVQVSAAMSIPSTLAAYHLYGDANRAGQLVALARAATPMLLPTQFDALAE